MKKIFVSILNYNNEKITIDCLETLSRCRKNGMDIHIIVADNNSREGFTIDKTKFPKLQLQIIRNEKNFGFSKGHNDIIKKSLNEGADYILILNNDTLLDENILINLLKGFEREKNIGIVVPKIYFTKGSEFHKDRYKNDELGKVIWYAGGEMDSKNVIGYHRGVDEVDRGQYDIVGTTLFATGCCMMVARDVFEKIGFFDEQYFLYYEDSD